MFQHMMIPITKLIVVVLFVVQALAAEVDKEEGVWVLTKNNFEETISANNYVLVEFYSPKCGHCKQLAPEYDKVAEELLKKESAILLAKVDAIKQTELASEYGVEAYPTLIFFKHQKLIEYAGSNRSADAIIAWAEKKTSSPAATLSSLDDSNNFIGSNKVVVIGLFKDQESDEAKHFWKLLILWKIYNLV